MTDEVTKRTSTLNPRRKTGSSDKVTRKSWFLLSDCARATGVRVCGVKEVRRSFYVLPHDGFHGSAHFGSAGPDGHSH